MIVISNSTTHPHDQSMIFNILSAIDYSKPWEEIEYGLGYDLGDYSFEHRSAYPLTVQAAKSLWAVFNDKMNGKNVKP